MKQFCLKQASKRVSLWRELNIFSANDIARMTEVEFISELTLSLIDGLVDHSASLLNRFYSEYDETFEQMDEIERRIG